MEDLLYPVGRFQPLPDYNVTQVNNLIWLMEQAPMKYEQALGGLADHDLEKTYRPGSWTVRQLVHHVADIHLLNYLRVKKAITEENYEITLIRMDDWARTPDAAQAPVQDSLVMLAGLNPRFVYLFKSLDPETLKKSFYHPVRQMHLSLKQLLYMAVWHLAHHQGHIALALGQAPPPFGFN